MGRAGPGGPGGFHRVRRLLEDVADGVALVLRPPDGEQQRAARHEELVRVGARVRVRVRVRVSARVVS